jgi:hypothetical protein
MKTRSKSDTEFADALERVAAKNAEVLESMQAKDRPTYVRSLMKRSKVVFAIWYTRDERHCYCIKGRRTPAGKVQATAFIVGCAADAEGMKRAWGDQASTPSSMD